MQEQEFLTNADIRCEIDSQIQEIKAILEMMASVEVTANPNVKGSDSAKLVSQIMCARVLEKLVSKVEQLNDSIEEIGEAGADREQENRLELKRHKVMSALKWANGDKVSEKERDVIFGFCERLGLPIGWEMNTEKLTLCDSGVSICGGIEDY